MQNRTGKISPTMIGESPDHFISIALEQQSINTAPSTEDYYPKKELWIAQQLGVLGIGFEGILGIPA